MQPILQLDSGLIFEGTYEDVVGTDVLFSYDATATKLSAPVLARRKLVFRQVNVTRR